MKTALALLKAELRERKRAVRRKVREILKDDREQTRKLERAIKMLTGKRRKYRKRRVKGQIRKGAKVQIRKLKPKPRPEPVAAAAS